MHGTYKWHLPPYCLFYYMTIRRHVSKISPYSLCCQFRQPAALEMSWQNCFQNDIELCPSNAQVQILLWGANILPIITVHGHKLNHFTINSTIAVAGNVGFADTSPCHTSGWIQGQVAKFVSRTVVDKWTIFEVVYWLSLIDLSYIFW